MIAWACIAPHGGAVVPELADGEPHQMAVTRAAMEELGRRAQLAQPETLVVLTPHGIACHRRICVSVGELAVGELAGPGGTIGALHPVDMPLAAHIALALNELDVPNVVASVDRDFNPVSIFPLDFAAIIPLWFIGARWDPPPHVVVVCPNDNVSKARLFRAGGAIAIAAARTQRRVGVICSVDHGHGHQLDGPYGFSPTSAEYDEEVCQAIKDNALNRLRRWRRDWVESAMVDSYWPLLILHGILSSGTFRSELLSYEAPTYFGMACAEFVPAV